MSATWPRAARAARSPPAGRRSPPARRRSPSRRGRELGRGVPRQRDDRRLRRRVVDARDRAARLAGVAREVDDPPFAAVAQVRADDAAAEVRPAEVRREDVVPLVDVDLEERPDLGARGVVDERVDVVAELPSDVASSRSQESSSRMS